MSPLVSIVINNFNYGRFVGAAIESALRQEDCPVEVIVVDDGSTDESRGVIERFGDRVRPVFKSNGGQASAFNAGIPLARGEFTLLLDSDDMLHSRAAMHAQAAFMPGYSRVAWQLRFVDEGGNPLPPQRQQTLYSGFDGDPIDAFIRAGAFPMIPTSGNLFRTATLKSLLPIPENTFRISADVPILVAISHHGLTRVLDVGLTDYRVHGANQFMSNGDLFSPTTVERHLRASIELRALLEVAAKQRNPSFASPPIVAQLSNAVKVQLAKRFGVVPQELRQGSLAAVLRAYWANSRRRLQSGLAASWQSWRAR